VIAALAAHAEKKEPVALDALAALFRRGYFSRCPSITDDRLRVDRYARRLAAWMLDHDEDSYKKSRTRFSKPRHGWPDTRAGCRQHHAALADEYRRLVGAAVWENFRAIFAALAAGKKPANFSLPVAFTVFPSEIFQAPRSWAEKVYPNLTPGSARQHRRVAADQFWRPTGFWRTTHILANDRSLAEDTRTSSLEICAFERRDELHIRYVLPRETVVVRDEQIDPSGRRTSKLDGVGRLNGAVGPNCCITRALAVSNGRTVAICRIVVS